MSTENAAPPASNFDALLAEIDTLGKALPKGDDGKIAAAAGEAGADVPAVEGDPANPDAAGETGDPTIAKSFKLKLDDGTEIDAMDGGELIKSLTGRVERTEGVLAKAIEGLTTLVKAQGEELARLRVAPQPRKTVLTVNERPAATLAKSEPAGVSGPEFMAKAMTAQAAGKITGLQVAIAEQSINAGQPPPAAIVQAVLG